MFMLVIVEIKLGDVSRQLLVEGLAGLLIIVVPAKFVNVQPHPLPPLPPQSTVAVRFHRLITIVPVEFWVLQQSIPTNGSGGVMGRTKEQISYVPSIKR